MMAGLEAEQAFLRSMMQEGEESGTQTPRSPNNTTANKQPRTIGGFIDDDDEDEEDVSKPREAVVKGSMIIDRDSSNTPQQKSSDSDVPSHDVTTQSNAQDRDDADGAVLDSHSNGVPSLTTVLPNDGAVAEESETAEYAPSPTIAQTAKSTANSVAQIATVQVPSSATVPAPKARLPHDRIGILEDRIKEDPRGDVDAWLSLITEHRKRNKIEDARNTYERFFKVFPTAAEQWVAYANMELETNDFYHVERIFEKSLLEVPSVQLWSAYLDYVRRRNNITTDTSGNARQIVNQTYEFVLLEKPIGMDKDSGPLWQDYLQFIRSGPGQIGGTGWQDQQKMDSLRKAYQKAVCVPTHAVNGLWKEYDSFEMGLNKITGRKFLQEKSPAYMTARAANTALQNITRELARTTLPSLPPAFGFDGEAEYMKQVELWRKWIEWEKEDPLVLKDEDEPALKARILYVYKQAVTSLRFWPEMWCEAAQFCFSNGLEKEGTDFLTRGTVANPESCLIAFQLADRIESTTKNEEGQDSVVERGKAVREPYDQVLNALYDLIGKVKQRETQAIARINEHFQDVTDVDNLEIGDDDDDALEKGPDADTLKKAQIEAIQNGNAAQIKLLSRTVSFVWIALMRAMRRVQGKGKVGDPIGGSRQIFTDARSRGRLTSDVYVASALIEYHCYGDQAATKIFERGMKLFKDDEQFALEYLKYLVGINDVTNARVVFETTVLRLAEKPETLARSKPLYVYFHEFEGRYGELAQIKRVEERMRELFPEDPQLLLFSQRYSSGGFDPTAIRPIISPTQARAVAMPSIEKPVSVQSSPKPSIIIPLQANNSPKRPLDESDNESLAPARKIIRGESPLKGAAGRRMDAQKRTNLRNEMHQNGFQTLPLPPLPPPPSLPSGILHLLSMIPRAETYNATVFDPAKVVGLLQHIDLTKYKAQPGSAPVPQTGPQQYGYGQSQTPFGYVR